LRCEDEVSALKPVVLNGQLQIMSSCLPNQMTLTKTDRRALMVLTSIPAFGRSMHAQPQACAQHGQADAQRTSSAKLIHEFGLRPSSSAVNINAALLLMQLPL
jgi:hypothetical protein